MNQSCDIAHFTWLLTCSKDRCPLMSAFCNTSWRRRRMPDNPKARRDCLTENLAAREQCPCAAVVLREWILLARIFSSALDQSGSWSGYRGKRSGPYDRVAGAATAEVDFATILLANLCTARSPLRSLPRPVHFHVRLRPHFSTCAANRTTRPPTATTSTTAITIAKQLFPRKRKRRPRPTTNTYQQ